MPSEFPYSKLPGRRRGLFVNGSIWLGADHFLSVKNLRFTEDYKRFYFRDIQAIFIRKAPRFYIPMPWMWAILACLIAVLFTSRTRYWMITGALMLTPVAIALWIVFAAIFQSCRCHIQTAVSREEIPALMRLRDARRTAEILSVKITESQGSLPPDWTLADAEPAPIPTGTPQQEPTPVVTNSGMRLALTSFLLLLGDAAFTYVHSHNPLNRALQSTGSLLIIVEAAVMVFSLVLLRGVEAVRSVRNLVIAGLVFAGATYYVSYTATSTLQNFAPAHTQTYPFVIWIGRANEVGNILIGFTGLAAWVSTRRKLSWPA